MNQDLHLLQKVCAAKRLAMNCTKTVYMQFSLTRLQEQMTIRAHLPLCTSPQVCNCPQVLGVDSFPYLGVIYQSDLRWNKQVARVHQSGRSFLSKLFYLKKITPKYVQRGLYLALFQSKITYGLVVWGGTYKTTLKPVLTTQKYVMRVIENENRLCPSRPLFTRLRIMPLRYLFIYVTTRCFFKRSGQMARQGTGSHDTRNPDRYVVPRPRTDHFKKTAFYLGPVIFNSLPDELINCPKNEIFKERVKRHLWSENRGAILDLIVNDW